MQFFDRFRNQDNKTTQQHQELVIVDDIDATELDALQGDMALINRTTELHLLRDSMQTS